MKPNYQLIATIICGSLAGAIFTYWMQRPDPTVLTYSETTTTLGTSNLKIPGLTIRIGKEIVPVLNTHSIDIGAQRGRYLAQAQVAIAFARGVRFFGISTEQPTPSHSINCVADDANVLQCKIGPFRVGERPFRIIAVTDQYTSPIVSCRDDVTLVATAGLSAVPEPAIFGLHIRWPIILIIALMGLAAAALAGSFVTKRLKSS